ncbi:hypothetical protein SAMN06296273_0757 [Nitrosomonas ureae]|uniref:Uncharacterized protein n=1 Tax=Nitrosomonas ureae TaxID=44577 RepID=A0A285BVS4_9PROT|nr:hypothetical protein SAMN06296273_0757 [Nitrosomonas ureae]
MDYGLFCWNFRNIQRKFFVYSVEVNDRLELSDEQWQIVYLLLGFAIPGLVKKR